MTQVIDISTKDTAAMLRRALRAAWPTVRFTVRMDRGSAYGWLHVSWEDGPTTSQVNRLARAYEGSRFNGQDDTYHRTPNTLVYFASEQLPQEVSYACCGVNTSRRIGAQGYARVAAMMNAAQPGVARLRADGRGLATAYLDDQAAAHLDVLPGPVDVACAAWRLHHRIDFTEAG
ncbi:MAG: LPD29 domain-containing protein [Nocardioides sp.]